MERASNYGVITDIYGAKEADSFTCFHCQKVVTVMPRQRGEDIGGICKICMQLVCPQCVDLGKCDPWEKKMERIESRDKFLRECGL